MHIWGLFDDGNGCYHQAVDEYNVNTEGGWHTITSIGIGDAGLILIDEIDTFDFRGNIYEFGGFVKKAKRIKGSVKLNEQEKEYYMRIGCMKWVNR